MNKLEEAINIISELLELVGWLGGDSYEQECIAESIQKANEFCEKENQEEKKRNARNDSRN